MSNSALAEKLEPLARKVPVIDPAQVRMNYAGHVFKEVMVRVPHDFVADDLKEPGAWSRVQASRDALCKFDRVIVVAWDESWIAETIVAHADSAKVVLTKPRLLSLPDRYEALFQTEEYRVVWTGGGYAVERKRDSHRMTHIVTSAAIAERDLQQLYPRHTGAA